MPEIRYPLSINVRRHDPPVTRDDLRAQYGADEHRHVGSDVAIVLACNFDRGELVQLTVVQCDGRIADKHGRTWCPGGPVPPADLVTAWLQFGRAIVEDASMPDEVRDVVRIAIDRAHEHAQHLNDRDAPRVPVEGAPSWVTKQGRGFGVDVQAAWGEVLGVELEERIAALPLALQLEWQAFLAGFTRRMGVEMTKRRPGDGSGSEHAAAKAIGIFVRAEVHKAIRNGQHPKLEVRDA